MSAISGAIRIGAALLILAGMGLVIDFQAIWRLLDARLLLAMLLMQPVIAVAWLLAGWRFDFLIPAPRPGLLRALKAVLLANGLNLVIPARIGELVKATYLREHAGVPLESGFAAVFMEKLQDFAVISVIGLLALLSLPLQGNRPIVVVTAAIGAVAVMLIAVFRSKWEKLLSASHANRARAAASFLTGVASAMRGDGFWPAMACGIGAFAALFAASWIFVSLQRMAELDLMQFTALFALTLLAGAIPGLPAGFGAYEGAAVLLLSGFGFPAEAGFALGLTLHLGQIVLSVLLAGIIAATDNAGIASVVQAALAKRQAAGASGSAES